MEFGREVAGIRQHADAVTVELVDPPTAAREHVRAAYPVGCDGGRSTVRGLAGIAMHGDRHAEHFVLADVRLSDPTRCAPGRAMLSWTPMSRNGRRSPGPC